MQKTLAVINLCRLRENAQKIRAVLGSRHFYAVVKADAYGHGAPEVARAIEDIVDGFCVAIIDEGAALRLSGITKPVIVFTPPLDEDDALRARLYSLEVTVNGVRAAKLSEGLPCHIKVNTGMNRTGCNIAQLPEVLQSVAPENILSVYSHLYNPASERDSLVQLKLFDRAEKIVKDIAPQAFAHIAASGGLLAGERYLKEGARCGILLYGYTPAGFNFPVEPIMKVYARRVQTTPFIGGGAGYARAKKNYKFLHTYRLGYADGFARNIPLGENMLCMDAFVSEKGAELLPVLEDAERYAARAGTISYEALCAATRRAERVYEE